MLELYPCLGSLLVYAFMLGGFGGLPQVLMSSIMCECAGVEQLGSSMGLAVMLLNLASALSSLFAGISYIIELIKLTL